MPLTSLAEMVLITRNETEAGDYGCDSKRLDGAFSRVALTLMTMKLGAIMGVWQGVAIRPVREGVSKGEEDGRKAV
jgi:hypothetical protein